MDELTLAAVVAAMHAYMRERQRADVRYSWRRFAQEVGMSPSALLAIRDGETRRPSMASIGKILARIDDKIVNYRTLHPRGTLHEPAGDAPDFADIELIRRVALPGRAEFNVELFLRMGPAHRARVIAHLRGVLDGLLAAGDDA